MVITWAFLVVLAVAWADADDVKKFQVICQELGGTVSGADDLICIKNERIVFQW